MTRHVTGRRVVGVAASRWLILYRQVAGYRVANNDFFFYRASFFPELKYRTGEYDARNDAPCYLYLRYARLVISSTLGKYEVRLLMNFCRKPARFIGFRFSPPTGAKLGFILRGLGLASRPRRGITLPRFATLQLLYRRWSPSRS